MQSLPFVHWLILASALISVSGACAYVRDTLNGTTKPNRVTWGMWAVAPLIGTSAAIAAGADTWATVRVFLAGFIPLIIFIASFWNPKGYWRLTFFDLGCGALSLLALIVWGLIDSPRMAILLSASADGFAALPTIRKAWLNPETETGVTYLAGLVSVILVLPSIPVWNIENAAFQMYLLAANGLLLIAVYRKRLRRAACCRAS